MKRFTFIRKARQRIVTNRNAIRVIYTLLGIFIIIEAIALSQWVGIILGAYVSSMGIFSLGCVGGNCSVPIHQTTKDPDFKSLENIRFEEIKNTKDGNNR